MTTDISSILGAGSSGYASTTETSSASEEETSALEELLEELEEAAEEKKTEQRTEQKEQSSAANGPAAIDMTKNTPLAASTMQTLLENNR